MLQKIGKKFFVVKKKLTYVKIGFKLSKCFFCTF